MTFTLRPAGFGSRARSSQTRCEGQCTSARQRLAIQGRSSRVHRNRCAKRAAKSAHGSGTSGPARPAEFLAMAHRRSAHGDQRRAHVTAALAVPARCRHTRFPSRHNRGDAPGRSTPTLTASDHTRASLERRRAHDSCARRPGTRTSPWLVRPLATRLNLDRSDEQFKVQRGTKYSVGDREVGSPDVPAARHSPASAGGGRTPSSTGRDRWQGSWLDATGNRPRRDGAGSPKSRPSDGRGRGRGPGPGPG